MIARRPDDEWQLMFDIHAQLRFIKLCSMLKTRELYIIFWVGDAHLSAVGGQPPGDAVTTGRIPPGIVLHSLLMTVWSTLIG